MDKNEIVIYKDGKLEIEVQINSDVNTKPNSWSFWKG